MIKKVLLSLGGGVRSQSALLVCNGLHLNVSGAESQLLDCE